MHKQKIIGIILIIGFLVTFFSIFIKTNDPRQLTGEAKVKAYLKEKYNDNFNNNITFIQSIKNSDTDINFDGSSFGTIKGKGYTEYYKVYSEKDDIEFEVIYDTIKTNSINDTYNNNLKIRENILLLYTKVKETFNDYIKYYSFSEDTHKINLYQINSKEDIRLKLSRLKSINTANGSFNYVNLSANINMKSLEFCKNNYDDLIKINDFLIELNHNLPISSMISFALIDSVGVKIIFDTVGNKIRIYDKFANNKVWGDEIDEFIKREVY